MRIGISVVALASLIAIHAGCTTGRTLGRSAAGRSYRPGQVATLRQEPLCIYRVLGDVSVRSSEGGTLASRARSLGAHAVLNPREIFEYNATGRPIASTWIATAVAFSDPTDPNCYR